MANGKSDVSAVVITYNEAVGIGACLDALAWCREIVVVDSGSTDGTQEICRRRGARVVEHRFEGFGAQKKFAAEQATSAWILSVDADEIVTPELAAEIASVAARSAGAHSGYRIRFRVLFMGRRLRFGPTLGEKHLRLFQRAAGVVDTARVHEAISVSGAVGTLRHPIVHRPYRDLDDYFSKFNAYTSQMARTRFQNGRRTHPVAVALAYRLALVNAYVLRLGFLDGYPGLVYCFLHAVHKTVKYAKLYELQRGTE